MRSHSSHNTRTTLLIILTLLVVFRTPQSLAGLAPQSAQAEPEQWKKLRQEVTKLIDEEKFKEALPLAQRAVALLEKLGPSQESDLADAISDLGVIYLETRDFAQAEGLLRRAVSIKEVLFGKEDIKIIDCLDNLSYFFRTINDGPNREQTLLRKISIQEKALGSWHQDVATSLNILGLFYLNRSDYVSAAPHFKRALEIREKALGKTDPLYAQSLQNLAALYRDSGDFAHAEPLFKQALAIREITPGPKQQDLASILNNLAGLYRDKGDYQQSEELFKRAFEIREKAQPESVSVADSLNNLALLYRQKSDYDQAEALYQRALAILEKVPNAQSSDIGRVLNNLGTLYLEKGDLAQAEPVLHRALTIREKALGADSPDTGQTISNLGTLAFYKGNYAESEALHQRALTIFEKSKGPQNPLSCLSRNNLAQICSTNGKFRRASLLLARNNYLREKNLSTMLSVGSEQDRLSYVATLSQETDFTVSFNVRLAPKNPQATRIALNRVFRLKGRVVDSMADSVGATLRRADQQDRDLLEQLSAARSRLAMLVIKGPGGASVSDHQSNITRLEAEVRRLEDAASARTAEFGIQSRQISFEAVQHAIPAGLSLVEIVSYRPFNPRPKSAAEVFGRPRYAAYVLHRIREPRAVDLGDGQKIDVAVDAFRKALRDPRSGGTDARGAKVVPAAGETRVSVRQLARRVDQLVMQPIRRLIGSSGTVVISPDGSLNLIPFAALVDSNQKYLVENYQFVYLTAGRDLLRLQTRLSGKSNPLLIGNPDYGAAGMASNTATESGQVTANRRSGELLSASYPSLDGAEREVDEVAKLVRGASVLKGKGATESALKATRSPSILHIATHGFFLPDEKKAANDSSARGIENPMLRSGLVLAGATSGDGGNGEDGILTALEAAGLDLWGTKLVVLSACETGVGEVKTGDGVYGLRRALVLAGSETQVMSLWKVDDEATQHLMTAFYARLMKGEGKGESLRRVQLSMLKNKDTEHPFFWAAFIQSGEWRRMQR